MFVGQAQAKYPMATTEDSKTLYMGDVQPNWDDNFVRSLFARFSGLSDIKLIRDKISGANLGYGFIEFISHETAEVALKALAGQVVRK